ncbi:hypothetical protein PtB15_3B58 [Puccinia triticina]|nr:hypothetical protein PtB15_3B58 [Puccinia triticina]
MIPWSFLFLVLMGMWIACYKAAEDVTWKSTWPVGHLLDWDDNQALNLDSFIYPTSTTTLQEPDHAKLSYQVQSLNSEKAQNPYQFKETGETSGGPTNGLDRVVDATAMDLEPFTFRVRPSEAVGTRQASSNDDLPARYVNENAHIRAGSEGMPSFAEGANNTGSLSHSTVMSVTQIHQSVDEPIFHNLTSGEVADNSVIPEGLLQSLLAQISTDPVFNNPTPSLGIENSPFETTIDVGSTSQSSATLQINTLASAENP